MMRAAELHIDEACWSPSRHAAPVLHPVQLRLAAGSVLGVVGANGAGKSTLLRLIYRYYRPRSGRVAIDGVDIWSMPARIAARNVAVVLQEQAVDFAFTVRSIVDLGRTPHRPGFSFSTPRDRDIVESALERLDIAHLAARRFGSLSGGERQRVMVARALVQEPALLVLDEPTNHLDIRHQLEIINLIRDLDMTVVASLHDLNMAALVCDDILLLSKGKTVGVGPPDRVLADDMVSLAFGIRARRERLMPSNIDHFTYQL
ncbi:ABC transporter ATP-binding protein [Notoacmeibacter marinus]